MACSGAQTALYASKVLQAIKFPGQVLVPVHNTPLAAPLTDLPLDVIINSLNDADIYHFSLETLEIMPSGRLHMLFLVKGVDGNQYLLTLSPPAGVRLLRHERSSIRSEAIILLWLSSLSIKRRSGLKAIISQDGDTSSPTNDDDDDDGDSNPRSQAGSLQDYLPKLTKHGSLDAGGHMSYNLTTPSRGTAISNLATPLSQEERDSVDYQAGQLLRRVSLYCSPDKTFGMAANTLPQITKSHHGGRFENKSDENVKADSSSDSWSKAFHILLESGLRDAEDLLLTISYDRIRNQFNRFRHFLDAVSKPRFVTIDVCDDTNTLVQRYEGTLGSRHGMQTCKKSSGLARRKGRITVTGLRDWSHCIFGDPLMASAFSTNSSPEFVRGFHSRLEISEQGLPDYASSPIEDQANAHVRLLLYECFHSLVAVVKEGYRWRHDSHMRELAGRKKLLEVLARLDSLDDEGNPKHERPGIDMTPSKRAKSEDFRSLT